MASLCKCGVTRVSFKSSNSSDCFQGADHLLCFSSGYFAADFSQSSVAGASVQDRPGCGTQRPAPTWPRDRGGLSGKTSVRSGLNRVHLHE